MICRRWRHAATIRRLNKASLGVSVVITVKRTRTRPRFRAAHSSPANQKHSIALCTKSRAAVVLLLLNGARMETIDIIIAKSASLGHQNPLDQLSFFSLCFSFFLWRFFKIVVFRFFSLMHLKSAIFLSVFSSSSFWAEFLFTRVYLPYIIVTGSLFSHGVCYVLQSWN